MHVDTTQPINLLACLAYSPCFFFIDFCFKNLPVYMWPQRGVFMLQDKPCELIRDSWGLLSFYNYRLISKFNVKCVLASLIRSYKALFNLCISSYHFHYSHPQPIIADRTFQDRWPIIKAKEFFSGCMSLLRTLHWWHLFQPWSVR